MGHDSWVNRSPCRLLKTVEVVSLFLTHQTLNFALKILKGFVKLKSLARYFANFSKYYVNIGCKKERGTAPLGHVAQKAFSRGCLHQKFPHRGATRVLRAKHIILRWRHTQNTRKRLVV